MVWASGCPPIFNDVLSTAFWTKAWSWVFAKGWSLLPRLLMYWKWLPWTLIPVAGPYVGQQLRPYSWFRRMTLSEREACLWRVDFFQMLQQLGRLRSIFQPPCQYSCQARPSCPGRVYGVPRGTTMVQSLLRELWFACRRAAEQFLPPWQGLAPWRFTLWTWLHQGVIPTAWLPWRYWALLNLNQFPLAFATHSKSRISHHQSFWRSGPLFKRSPRRLPPFQLLARHGLSAPWAALGFAKYIPVRSWETQAPGKNAFRVTCCW